MIPISRLPAPEELAYLLVSNMRALEAIHTAGSNADHIYQSSADFKKHSGLIKNALNNQFAYKCAYCESPLRAAGHGQIDHFRPKSGVADIDGSYLPNHYWRQVYDWRNLYLACAVCNRNKANRFPVAGIRAKMGATFEELYEEMPLLLDPCADETDHHLCFTSDGLVIGLTDRGRSTIEVFSLNRTELVEARKDEATLFLHAIEFKQQDVLLALRSPYLSLKRQLLAAQGKDSVSDEAKEASQVEQTSFDSIREQVSTEKSEGLDHYRARARYIEYVHIENIASISHLELNIQASEAGSAPCFALLGNNGAGKTTVLRAIAVALAGEHYARKLKLTSSSLLRDGASSGVVRLRVSGYRDDIVMTLQRGKRLVFNRTEPCALVLAYGASRLLARPGHKGKPGLKHAKIDNLFDPFLAITDAETWLTAAFHDSDRFQEATTTLQKLVPHGELSGFVIPRGEEPVRIQLNQAAPRRIKELSDGYQSLLGIGVDLLSVMFGASFASMNSAQGIVLIDELGNHFHPSWRLRIVSALRNAFPQVQFIFSTHDPLCLRGLAAGEVAVLRHDATGSVYALDELPNVADLRVDQLLTSEHFGLESTVDPSLDDQIQEYHRLCDLPARDEHEQKRSMELAQLLTQTR